jgi:thioredoxin-like negative regulator of GroEL
MTIAEISVSNEELRVMLETGYILREAAQFDRAEAIFRGAMEFLPESDVPQVGLATVFLQKGDFQAAEEICESALELNPESLYARLHYAEALLFGRQREKAETELLSIIGKDPDSPHSRTAQSLLEAVDLISPN